MSESVGKVLDSQMTCWTIQESQGKATALKNIPGQQYLHAEDVLGERPHPAGEPNYYCYY